MASKSAIKLSFLFSYAYIRTGGAILHDTMQALAPKCRIMIDSGAFTNYKTMVKSAKQKKPFQPITLDEYMKACQDFQRFYQYIQLDVIGNPQATRRNFDIMQAAGLNPMPVFTGGAPWADLAYYSTKWQDICYGGIVRHAKNKVFVQNITNGLKMSGGKARFHLLGFARYPLVLSLPIKSFDSSSYAAGQQYGRLGIFSPQRGIYSLDRNENSNEYIAELHRHNISPEILKNGHWIGQRGMPTMTTMFAHLSMMQYVLQTRNLFYFLAVPNMHLLEALLSVYASMKGDTYDYPEALERYEEIHAAHDNPNRVIDLAVKYATK